VFGRYRNFPTSIPPLENNVSIDAESAPPLRGFVNLYDGETHSFDYLIIISKEENGKMHFELNSLRSLAK
jgi:hypothetical protein